MMSAGGPRSFVAEVDRRPVGLAQMAPYREPTQWEVAYLAVEPSGGACGATNGSEGASRSGHSPDRTAARLLGALCDAAVSLHATRLLARVAEEDGRYELFKRLGFSSAVREYSYYHALADASPPIAADAASLLAPVSGLRPQRRADTMSILQLYQASTPKVVQMAESKTTRSWPPATRGLGERLTRRPKVQRWVLERDARKVAWLQIEWQSRGPHQVRLMVDDETSHLTRPLLNFALRIAGTRPRNGVVVVAREHQSHLIAALEEAEFLLINAQLLMIKLLATPVLQPQFARALKKVV
jgi:hypothetical protein